MRGSGADIGQALFFEKRSHRKDADKTVPPACPKPLEFVQQYEMPARGALTVRRMNGVDALVAEPPGSDLIEGSASTFASASSFGG